MKVGERGQVTIPSEIRDSFGFGAETEVEFHVVGGCVTLRKASRYLNLSKWTGYCSDSFTEPGYASVDDFIEDVRGR